MLWRARLNLPDRPGTLATLAQECGDAGINIMGVQVFPGIDTVTDELVLEVPEGLGQVEIAEVVERSGATAVTLHRCTEAALLDQPTLYVQAARAILDQPSRFPEVAARLFDGEADPGPDARLDVMEMTVGDVVVQVRREAPFTAFEHARGAAIAELVSDVLQGAPAAHTASSGRLGEGVRPSYVVRGLSVLALVDGATVGRGLLMDSPEPGARRLELEVDPQWRRRGVASRLLVEVARVAHDHGDDELTLETSAENRAVLPMVLGCGLRCRIRLVGSRLHVRVPVRHLEPSRL
ncbi:GNAT family N-acetyltransferase [Nocardioides seonyuensis]|uniref:GNAT family N-acetyltransferase n=1 Tax=Nocardioides seonyuensis TaxID=2518371 RepID=A0A4P7IFV4_9ACTN|nr:GNAT family N-acetyltransferase [Nocardioides seonyuensis]QBX56155.1 GNAT family N-acetyltransferase [Nocardioides seonyuensis]